MGGVYLGEEKNGGRSDLWLKAASLCTPPPLRGFLAPSLSQGFLQIKIFSMFWYVLYNLERVGVTVNEQDTLFSLTLFASFEK